MFRYSIVFLIKFIFKILYLTNNTNDMYVKYARVLFRNNSISKILFIFAECLYITNKDKNNLFLMNGQNRNSYLESEISKIGVVIISIIVFIFIFMIIFLILNVI